MTATGHRWLAALATYDFSLQYKPGKHNLDADVLSRYPTSAVDLDEWKEVSESAVKAVCQMTSCSEISVRLIDQLGVPPQIIPQLYMCPVQLGPDQMAGVTFDEFRDAQEQDTVIGLVKKAVESGSILSMLKSSDPNVVLMQRQGKKLINQTLASISGD